VHGRAYYRGLSTDLCRIFNFVDRPHLDPGSMNAEILHEKENEGEEI